MHKTPLFQIKIKFTEELTLFENVFQGDNPISVSDRLLKHPISLQPGSKLILGDVFSKKHHR